MLTASFSQEGNCTVSAPVFNATAGMCEKCTEDSHCTAFNLTCAKNEKVVCLKTGECGCAEKPGVLGTIVNAFSNLGIPSIVIYVLLGLIALWILSTVAAKLIKFGIIILILFIVAKIVLDIIK